MKTVIAPLIILTAMVISFEGCSKKTDTYQTEPLTDYYINLEPGKFIRYRLDSTLYIQFGQKDTTISYEAKDEVDGQITDALGRPGWRILRYLRPVGSTDESAWDLKLAYFVVPTNGKLEVIENNLRYIKLISPVLEGNTWHGNAYLPDHPFEQFYGILSDAGLQFWDYTYQNKGTVETVNDVDYDSTLSVHQVEEEEYTPALDFRNYWIEKYAKGIGLIYKEMIMWEHQPAVGSNPDYWQGFGLKLTIIDHN
jgi:hypothetical protein